MIVDACVLIDFINVDRYLLKLIAKHIRDAYVVSPVIDEIKSINEEELTELDLIIIEPDIEDAFSSSINNSSLSFQDNLCFFTAKRYNLTCITNDRKLRELCKNEDVHTIWGLELLIKLHEARGISIKDAIDAVNIMHKTNPRYITAELLQKFICKIKNIKKQEK